MSKAPMAQEALGRNPTVRGKKGKQEASGGGQAWRPWSLVVTGASSSNVPRRLQYD
jgi:hypothetical protein